MSVIFEVQKAVYAKLTGDAPLMAMINGVFDFVPEGTDYPYVTIGDIAAEDNSAVGVKGYELDLRVNVYSKSQGKSQCLDIVERLKIVLDGQALMVAGFSHVYSKMKAVETSRGQDNVILSANVSFEILVRVV